MTATEDPISAASVRHGLLEIGAAMWNHLPRMREQAREHGARGLC